jgi:hypothetical protein
MDKILKVTDLVSFKDTVEKVKQYIKAYWTDILLYPELLKLSPIEFFYKIKSMKYVPDPKGIEFVSRIGICLKSGLNNEGLYFDCDDRTGVSGAYFFYRNNCLGEKNKLNIVVSGQKTSKRLVKTILGEMLMNYPHHIYLEVNEMPYDPTYPENEYGKKLFDEGFREVFKLI